MKSRQPVLHGAAYGTRELSSAYHMPPASTITCTLPPHKHAKIRGDGTPEDCEGGQRGIPSTTTMRSGELWAITCRHPQYREETRNDTMPSFTTKQLGEHTAFALGDWTRTHAQVLLDQARHSVSHLIPYHVPTCTESLPPCDYKNGYQSSQD